MRVNIYRLAIEYAVKIYKHEYNCTLNNAKRIFKEYYDLVFNEYNKLIEYEKFSDIAIKSGIATQAAISYLNTIRNLPRTIISEGISIGHKGNYNRIVLAEYKLEQTLVKTIPNFYKLTINMRAEMSIINNDDLSGAERKAAYDKYNKLAEERNRLVANYTGNLIDRWTDLPNNSVIR